ncbi:MAG: hypothetical protein K6348_08305 [Deferribacterales bacterium]
MSIYIYMCGVDCPRDINQVRCNFRSKNFELLKGILKWEGIFSILGLLKEIKEENYERSYLL